MSNRDKRYFLTPFLERKIIVFLLKENNVILIQIPQTLFCVRRCSHFYANSTLEFNSNVKSAIIFRVTGPLRGESTGNRWIPLTKGQRRGALMFSLVCARTNGWSNNRNAGDLRRHGAHSDVTLVPKRHGTLLMGSTRDQSLVLSADRCSNISSSNSNSSSSCCSGSSRFYCQSELLCLITQNESTFNIVEMSKAYTWHRQYIFKSKICISTEK